MDVVLALAIRATEARRLGRLADAAERELELRFACSRRLAVYGTLAPGERHHDELADCAGRWSSGTVTGRLAQREYPEFTFDAAAPPVGVHVLDSAGLPAHWSRLDAFEGDQYRRVLVPVHLDGGSVAVANLYEAVRLPEAR